MNGFSQSRSGRDKADELCALVQERGITLFGVADLAAAEIEVRYIPKRALAGLDKAVVLGARLSDRIVESLENGPTPTYRYHYRQTNQVLDSAASTVTAWLQERGYGALPIPSSQILDWKENKGHIWHVATACLAGLAWRGRSNLAVNPLYGARVRYVTVLTDADLPAGRPLEEGCAECVRCIAACPAGAIGQRPEDFAVGKCDAMLKKFSKELSLGVKICGICVWACPGKRGWRSESGE